MMEKRHRCKLCFRNFANGRALGGHMKSHMTNLHNSSKDHQEENKKYVDDHESDLQETNEFQLVDRSYSSSPSSSSSFASDDDEEEQDEAEGLDKSSSYKLRENPRKTTLLADNDFSSDVVEEDTESEAESPKESRVLMRSKRKKLTPNDEFLIPENETSSSISDTSTEEHVAHCLMMLSRDTWTREDIIEYSNLREGDRFEDSGSAQKVMLKCNNNSSGTNKVRGRYRCETCNKLFKSYQALGGHRASHKKIRPAKPVIERTRPGTADAGEKLHKCPFCDRVFTSGQALGGHKRTHSVNGGGNNNNGDSFMIGIDLNLPAPIDEDDHEIISKISNSDENYF